MSRNCLLLLSPKLPLPDYLKVAQTLFTLKKTNKNKKIKKKKTMSAHRNI